MTPMKVSSPAELISAMPFLIGFHPADSLAVVAMHGPRISFTVRIDLPEHGTPDEEAKAAVLHLAAVVRHQEAEAVTIIGYGEESRVTPAVLRISEAFRKADVTIVDELRVTDGRYWSYLCTDESCCPAEGRVCEPPYSVVAAEATFAGAVALPNREALAAQLTPVTGDDREAMTAATARAILRLAALAGERPPAGEDAPAPGENPRGADELLDSRPGLSELRLGSVLWASLGLATPSSDADPEPDGSNASLLSDEDYFFARVRSAGRMAVREAERCYSTGGRLSDDDAAWLGVLLLHVPVRDYAWTRTRTQDWELALWSDLARRVEARYCPAPAGLLAFVAFRMGMGPLAGIAVERALEQDSDYPLALMMLRAIIVGLPPSALDGWPALDGMPLVSDCEEAVAPEVRIPSDVPSAGPQHEGAGDLGRQETRQPKPHRASHRRV
jgi:hypothetical protein